MHSQVKDIEAEIYQAPVSYQAAMNREIKRLRYELDSIERLVNVRGSFAQEFECCLFCKSQVSNLKADYFYCTVKTCYIICNLKFFIVLACLSYSRGSQPSSDHVSLVNFTRGVCIPRISYGRKAD